MKKNENRNGRGRRALRSGLRKQCCTGGCVLNHSLFMFAASTPLNPLPSTFQSHIPHTGKVNTGWQACTGSNEMKDDIL